MTGRNRAERFEEAEHVETVRRGFDREEIRQA
jgi:hypothetical protein